MANNSHFLHPASCAVSNDIVPSNIAIPNVLRIVTFSLALMRELYTRIESMCRIPNGGGATNPSCVATMFTSSSASFDFNTAAAADDDDDDDDAPSALIRRTSPSSSNRRAIILNTGPVNAVSSVSPRAFAASSNSSLVMTSDGFNVDDARAIVIRACPRARYIARGIARRARACVAMARAKKCGDVLNIRNHFRTLGATLCRARPNERARFGHEGDDDNGDGERHGVRGRARASAGGGNATRRCGARAKCDRWRKVVDALDGEAIDERTAHAHAMCGDGGWEIQRARRRR